MNITTKFRTFGTNERKKIMPVLKVKEFKNGKYCSNWIPKDKEEAKKIVSFFSKQYPKRKYKIVYE
jgi:hypothetical protein